MGTSKGPLVLGEVERERFQAIWIDAAQDDVLVRIEGMGNATRHKPEPHPDGLRGRDDADPFGRDNELSLNRPTGSIEHDHSP